MDPVTIVSVSAASFQFAELALKSISKIAKMSKDLEDVPKRLSDELNGIETSITRMRDFSTDLTRDASVSSIEPSRLASLTLAVNNWMTTAANLEATLQDVLNPSTASRRRKWQIAFQSLRQADDIELQIQRLQSLNYEIWGELLRTLLASQLQIKCDILDSETNITSKLQVAFQRFQDEQLNCQGHLVATIQEEGTNTQTTLDNLTRSMNNNTRTTLDNLITSMNAGFGQLSLQASQDQKAVVSRINAYVSEELRAMCAFMSSSTRGNQAFLDHSPKTSNMTPPLVRGGSPLTAEVDSLEMLSGGNAPAAPDPFIPFHQRSWYANQISPPCCCPVRIKRVWQVLKGIRLRYKEVKHVFPCPQSLEMEHSRSVSMHIELPRFMGPTMEVSVAKGTVRTGYAFSQTFRYFPTVKRLDSPIFGQFDELQSFFQKGDLQEPLEQIDIEAVRCNIRDLPGRLQRIAATGAGSCRDKDEAGNTLLLVCVMIYHLISPSFSENASQETVYVMLCLKHRLPEVSAELTLLLEFLRTVGLDASGTGMKLLRTRHRSCVLGIEGYTHDFPLAGNINTYYPTRRSTAQSLALVFAQDAPEYFSVSSYFKGFELESYCSIDSSFPACIMESGYGRSCQRQKAASFFRLNQALASELGSLEGAVARRDMVGLKSILRKLSFDPREYQWAWILGNVRLSGFQLAMDWQEGIEELLTKFAPTSADIEFAIHIDSPLSLQTLKILWHRMRGSLNYKSIFQILLRTSDRAENQVFELLQESLLELHQFAMVLLNEDQKRNLCLTSHNAADWRMSEVWATLISQGCDVPRRYKPMRKDFLYSLFDGLGAFETFFRPLSSQDEESTRFPSELLQRYCDMGFLEVNCKRLQENSIRAGHKKAGQTPFRAFLKSFNHYAHLRGGAWFPRFTEICLWLLNHEASTQDFEDQQPNLLFSLARFIALDSWSSQEDDCESRYCMDLCRQHKLWATALKLCSVDQRDACQCFCSVSRCLPSRTFLQARNSACCQSRTPRAALDKRIFLWSGLCQLSQEQEARYVEDAIQLEVFTRLGMTHTCCLPANELRWNGFQSHELESDDIKEIQFEESELKSHLDLIMEAYVSFIREFDDCHSGLSKWWMILEGTLPDLSDLRRPWWADFRSKEEYEHAVHDVEKDRATLEAQTLQSNEYEGMDFMDVIRLHFGEYLQDRTVETAE